MPFRQEKPMPTPTRKLHPFALTDVTIDDAFWTPRQEANRAVSIPHILEMCRQTGRVDAFKLDWKPGDPNPPHIFWDSDVAKWIEAASYSLATHPDKRLEEEVDEVVDLVVSAQQPEGYLNVHFTVVEPEKRWTNLRDWHELYAAGHLMEAAVAHYQATGKRNLLDALCRYADYIDSVFGRAKGRKRGYCGHEELELALVKLYRATGERRYLKLSRYFLDERGRRPHYLDKEAQERGDAPQTWWARDYSYCQAHKPVRKQDEAVGHAVRAMYLYCGMADVAAETGDEELLTACRRLWTSAVERKMYVTGGVGSAHQGEKFTADYDLPNESAYAETCAAIGLVFFAHRMLQIEADGKYADVLERALYNGVLSGVGVRGDTFFYVNPLASAGGHHRQEFFGCACCPPNLARLVAELGSYVYATSGNAICVNLYVGGEGETELAGWPVTLRQETRYPWDGGVQLTLGLGQPTKFDLRLRIPGWCPGFSLTLNGEPAEARVARGYRSLKREWQDGDVVELCLDLPVERIVANPAVIEAVGKIALQRGPLVYCLEQCDHSADVRSLALPDEAELTARFDSSLLGGATVIETTGLAPAATGWKGSLYRPLSETSAKPVKIKAIPYCLWDNREPGAMTVWLPRG
jgi:DUF1680 family protein